MKSILQSIKPQYCELIASGKKTVEVRKTRPKLDVPFKVYIYCTKGKLALLRDDKDAEEQYKYDYWDFAEFHQSNGMKVLGGKVIGEYVCDEIINLFALSKFWFPDEILSATCLTPDEIKKYANGAEKLYGWHISDLKIYDKPKELSELHKPCINPGMKICELCEFADFENTDVLFPRCINVLIHPPQSWCYVEE